MLLSGESTLNAAALSSVHLVYIGAAVSSSCNVHTQPPCPTNCCCLLRGTAVAESNSRFLQLSARCTHNIAAHTLYGVRTGTPYLVGANITVMLCYDQEKKARVDRLIQQLALQACRNTTIGSSLDRGVSGGEVTLTTC